MVSTFRLSILVALVSVPHLSTAGEQDSPAYTDHARLMVYRGPDGRQHPVRTAADWAIRRRHILAGMQQAMGPLPARSGLPALDVRVIETVKQEGVVRQTISFVADEASAGARRVTAYLYLPSKASDNERRPAMLALHPTGAQGKQIVAGLGPRANRGYAMELALRGYVVIAPDYPSFGDLKDHDFGTDGYDSGTMKGIFNHIRCVDVLVARDDVDPERIGVIGHSLGGHNAMFVGVFDERLKVTVSSCGWCPFHDYKLGKLAAWAQDRYMPWIRDRFALDPDRVPFDFYEVVAALAPRAFFSNSPSGDSNFEVKGVRKAIPAAREIYRLLGAADRLQVRYPDCSHDFPPLVRREAYEFIDQIFKHTPPKREKVLFNSSLDGTQQPSYVILPEGYDPAGAEVPLLVVLHSWSANLEQRNPAMEQAAERRGWILLVPNFRGRNDHPEACGSELAQQDILDAVEWAAQTFHVDRRRIYLLGSSGGGHMTMLMAGRHPQVWAAASAWVGISDLAAWHKRHADDKYGKMLRQSCSGAPGENADVDAQYRARSPLTHLAGAADLPLDLAAGVHDGHRGSVPIWHTLEAFNVVARALGAATVSEEEIRQLSRSQGRLDQPRPTDQVTDPTFGRAIYLRRTAGKARVTIFEGGHECLHAAAIDWLSRHRKK